MGQSGGVVRASVVPEMGSWPLLRDNAGPAARDRSVRYALYAWFKGLGKRVRPVGGQFDSSSVASSSLTVTGCLSCGGTLPRRFRCSGLAALRSGSACPRMTWGFLKAPAEIVGWAGPGTCGRWRFRSSLWVIAADFRNSPLSITGIPRGAERCGGPGMSLRGCQVRSSRPVSSAMVTGSSQEGQQPPVPARRMNVPHWSQRWFPRARLPQLPHS